jgi:hypothetical protein
LFKSPGGAKFHMHFVLKPQRGEILVTRPKKSLQINS